MKTLTPLDLIADRRLFGREFAAKAWAGWRVFFAALFAVLTADQLPLYRQCTGRTTAPTRPAREAHVIVGRRGGKSRIAALLAVFLACFRTYTLAPGERGVVMVIAADRRQARVVFRYILGFLNAVPMLAALIARQTRESLDLTNGISIEIHTSSFRAVRGYTVVGAICDEIAFWPTDDSADPDTEILNALRPAMATVPDALLLTISSPYAKRGELHAAHVKHFGQDGDPILVWQADTRTMNPTVPDAVIAKAYADDPSSAAAEYGAQFRADIEGYLVRAVLDAVTVSGCYERTYESQHTYRGSLDFAGGGTGANNDSAAACVTHQEVRDGRAIAVMDAIREVRPPFSPEQACAEFAAFFLSYGVERVTSDKWAGQFPIEGMAKHGVRVEPSAKPKSDLYRELLPLVNSSRVELLDHPRLLGQFASLERRTARGGRDAIDHPPKAHDDLANAAALALLLALEGRAEIALDDGYATTQEDYDAEMTRRNRAFADAIRAKGSWNLD